MKSIARLFVAGILIGMVPNSSPANAQSVPLFVHRDASISTLETAGSELSVTTSSPAGFPQLGLTSLNPGPQPLDAAFFPVALEPSETHLRTLYPLAGAVLGAGAGAIWGAHMMSSADDWVAPPAYIMTIPVGLVAGAFLGWIVEEAVIR